MVSLFVVWVPAEGEDPAEEGPASAAGGAGQQTGGETELPRRQLRTHPRATAV